MSQPRTIWPTFFIVGAGKAGTTSLYEHMKCHPQIFFPSVKEPYFFMTKNWAPAIGTNGKKNGNFEEYQRLYADAEGFPAIGDASPTYLWDREVAKRIHDVRPDARIIIILRDPVTRAYSQFLMDRIIFGGKSSFAEALETDYSGESWAWGCKHPYVELGLYYEQVRRYLELFGEDQVKIFLFNQLSQDPQSLFREIARHIGVEPEPFDSMDIGKAHNKTKMPRFRLIHRPLALILNPKVRQKVFPPSFLRWVEESKLFYTDDKPPLDDASRQYLQELYDPDIAKLEELLKRRLPELRGSWKWKERPVASAPALARK